MSASPALPLAAHDDVDSMLVRKFGRETANYFSGSPLNRLSFLRTDGGFLSAAFGHPSTRFLLLSELAPLAHSAASLSFCGRADIAALVPDDPYAAAEDQQVAAFDSSRVAPQLIFLGVDEGYAAPDTEARRAVQAQLDNQPGAASQPRPPPFEWTHNSRYAGRPYFAVDATPRGGYADAARALVARYEAAGLVWLGGRMHLGFPAAQAAVYAEARSLADWNARNPFCGGCGAPTLSLNGGFKRTCPPADAAQQPRERGPCPTRGVISNLSFPRTDPTVIMAVLSADSRRILLGRQRRFPPNWYSTLAGFVEPAESVEEAVRREVWEESGITLGRVQVHSTQPWPYPASLMIGAVGQAVPGGETIQLDNDPELEDARWFDIEDVRTALRVGISSLDENARSHPEYKPGGLKLPPPTAIANQLITAVIEGYAGAVGKL